MHRPISSFVFAIAIAALTGACSSSSHAASGLGNGASPTQRATTGPAAGTDSPGSSLPTGTKLHVRFTGEGPLPTLLTPLCQGKQCVIPATETGTFHGDLEGTHLKAGGTATKGTQFVTAGTDVFVGTVKGCGRGTFVLLSTEEATPTSGTGSGDIAVGYGTGDLVHLRGHIRGTGSAGANGIHSTYEGDLICEK